MKYVSTRGESPVLTFSAAVLEGLAQDGGLYVPETMPSVSLEQLKQWADLSFADLAVEVMSLFIPSEEIPRADLQSLCKKSFASFRVPEVTPVVGTKTTAQTGRYILELFHGPTYAFKDVALQFLGNLFEYLLKRLDRRLTVLGATSGDTGAAAIHGLKGKENVDVFILFPKGRVSPTQELLMTTVLDENVHNVAIEGTFDDAQAIVKVVPLHCDV